MKRRLVAGAQKRGRDGDGIYEFPVNTNDSFVESQEISSDMGSSLQQMMMSKQFASQAIKDNKGNVIAQAMVDGIIGESKIIKVGDDDIDEVVINIIT